MFLLFLPWGPDSLQGPGLPSSALTLTLKVIERQQMQKTKKTKQNTKQQKKNCVNKAKLDYIKYMLIRFYVFLHILIYV